MPKTVVKDGHPIEDPEPVNKGLVEAMIVVENQEPATSTSPVTQESAVLEYQVSEPASVMTETYADAEAESEAEAETEVVAKTTTEPEEENIDNQILA
jgi:hypothetical protein